MPRRQRLQATGLPVHIVQLGNNHQACFFVEADYWFFLDRLEAFSKRFECDLHAYVLMTNHVHLLLTPHLARGLSLLMKFLGQCYAQYMNRTHRRSGTLWEGRFRSSLVQSPRYVLACYRYIELNPVRAHMVKHPADYPWSSYAVNAEGREMKWLAPHGEYLALGLEDESRRSAYRDLFATELGPELLNEIRTSMHGGHTLGGGCFQREIERALTRHIAQRSSRQPGSPISGTPKTF